MRSAVHANVPIGASLRSARHRLGLTQTSVVTAFDTLSQNLGLEDRLNTKETLSKIERGIRVVQGREMLLLCYLLQINPWEIDPRLSNLLPR